MKRAALLLLLSAACDPAEPPSAPPPASAAARAARYLWSLQGPDGGWHSTRYGLLASGQSLTPFVLGVLLDVPESLHRPEPEAVERAVRFILAGVDPEGRLGMSDPSLPDYPNYATAMGRRVLLRTGHKEAAGRMRDALLAQQLADDLGWPRDHPAYGSWGMGGPARRPPHPGHLDLSMTRHVLEALDGGDAARRSLVFLDRCRNPDGGFLFSTVMEEKNKAGPATSYGTATADGVLALLAAGVPASDERVVRAAAWLQQHHRVDRVPGFSDDPEQTWDEAMRFYYQAAAARVFRRLKTVSPWRQEMDEALSRDQRADGSWTNSVFQMKEDDPLIATTLALRALLEIHCIDP